MRVTALQGDSVDSLCYRNLGSSAVVEQVLATNPGVAALGPVLPVGTVVVIPDSAPAPGGQKATINLWD